MLSDRAIWSGGRTPRQEVRVLKVFTSGAPGRRPCLGAGSARWSYLRSPAFLVRTPRRPARSSFQFVSICVLQQEGGGGGGREAFVPASCILCRAFSVSPLDTSLLGGRSCSPPPPARRAVMGTLAFQQTVGEGRASACEILMTQRFVVVYGHGVRALRSSPACPHAGGMQKAERQTVSSETAVSACGIFI